MNWAMAGVLVGVIVNLILIAGAWGDMRRQVSANREHQDERHEETRETLHEIRDDVKRINGTVARHAEVLIHHANEIDRLRDGS